MARKKAVKSDTSLEETEQQQSEEKTMVQGEQTPAEPKDSSPEATNDGAESAQPEDQTVDSGTAPSAESEGVDGTAEAEADDSTAGHYASKFEEVSAEYYDKLHDAAEQLSEYATELYESGKGYVKTNPTTTILGAFGVGVLIGLLIGKK